MGSEIVSILKTCSICKESFPTLRDLIDHEKLHTRRSTPVVSVINPVPKVESLAPAAAAASSTTTATSASNSVLLYDMWRCQDCPAMLSSREAYYRHRYRWHRECDSGRNFDTRSQKAKQTRLSTIWNLKCKFCAATFARRDAFREHMAFHGKGIDSPSFEHCGATRKLEISKSMDTEVRISTSGSKSTAGIEIVDVGVADRQIKMEDGDGVGASIQEEFGDESMNQSFGNCLDKGSVNNANGKAVGGRSGSVAADRLQIRKSTFSTSCKLEKLPSLSRVNQKSAKVLGVSAKPSELETRQNSSSDTEFHPSFDTYSKSVGQPLSLSRHTKLRRALLLGCMDKCRRTVPTPKEDQAASTSSASTENTTTEKVWFCKYCFHAFARQKSVRAHQLRFHYTSDGRLKYYCSKCMWHRLGKHFYTSEKELLEHGTNKHGITIDSMGELMDPLPHFRQRRMFLGRTTTTGQSKKVVQKKSAAGRRKTVGNKKKQEREEVLAKKRKKQSDVTDDASIKSSSTQEADENGGASKRRLRRRKSDKTPARHDKTVPKKKRAIATQEVIGEIEENATSRDPDEKTSETMTSAWTATYKMECPDDEMLGEGTGAVAMEFVSAKEEPADD